MAQVTVFVDDAVRGTLPSICVKDGMTTVDRLVIRDEAGNRTGLGVAWLLLLLGPPGWLGLVLISFTRGGRSEVLTVELPMSEPAYQRIQAARRLRRRAVVVGVLAGVVAMVSLTGDRTSSGAFQWAAVGLIAAAVVVVAVITLFVADHRRTKATVGVDLDASRRWVTLSRVHPAFVAACQAHEQRQVQRT
jgi:uncharacterized membrane protein YeaQ/YmgE (transglycosylase-associated protein family)